MFHVLCSVFYILCAMFVGCGPKTFKTNLPGGATMEMIWIEPGTFSMGTSEAQLNEIGRRGTVGHFEVEQPAHPVTLTRGFYLGRTEITQRQWESLMGTRPWSGRAGVQENPDHPAVCISWEDVQAFIAELNRAEEKGRYRLPTEAEWEYACRAGTVTPWWFGECDSLLGETAWYCANGGEVGEGYGHAVGLKHPNPWSVYDLYGNVWEWCQDWFGGYGKQVQVDPPGPDSGSCRVLRGGCFVSPAECVRSANRSNAPPGFRDSHIGARLVRQEIE